MMVDNGHCERKVEHENINCFEKLNDFVDKLEEDNEYGPR